MMEKISRYMERDRQSELILDIESLKSELQESDYKVIKCAEALTIGAEMPYDVASLHKERQALRDKINELEKAVGDEWCNEFQLFYFDRIFIYAIVWGGGTRWC